MFDDIPKNSQFRKFFYTILILAIFGVTAFYVYQKYFYKVEEAKTPAEKIINHINTTSPTPTTTAIPSPTASE